MMNIGIFTDCYLPTKNGVSTAIVQVKDELERRGHKVVVVTVAYPEYDPLRYRTEGLSRFSASPARRAETSNPASLTPEGSVYRFPSVPFNPRIELRLGLARQAALDRIVARDKLDLIHTHTEFTLGWGGKRVAQRAGLPLVHTLHTLYPEYRHYLPLGQLLPRRAVSGFLARLLDGYDVLVCPSEKIRAYVTSFMPGMHTSVIGNGVSRERFSPERITEADRSRARAALGIGASDRVILYVGRLAPEKRVLALFEALLPVLHARGDCRAVFVGSGPARDALAAAVRAAGLGPQVLLAGLVDWERMVDIYAIADAFVTASLSEVHPMTLIEAAMCGLPVVARRDISFVDMVKDGYNGFLVDSDRGIVEKVLEILRDEAKQRTFARNARALSGQFTIEAHVDRLEALYRQVLHHQESSQ